MPTMLQFSGAVPCFLARTAATLAAGGRAAKHCFRLDRCDHVAVNAPDWMLDCIRMRLIGVLHFDRLRSRGFNPGAGTFTY